MTTNPNTLQTEEASRPVEFQPRFTEWRGQTVVSRSVELAYGGVELGTSAKDAADTKPEYDEHRE